MIAVGLADGDAAQHIARAFQRDGADDLLHACVERRKRERPVIAVARDGDDVYAVQDLCSHQAVALSEGEVDGCTIECWLHGSRFDLASGKPTGPPATEPVSTFPVEVRTEPEGLVVYVDTTTTLNGVNPT